MVPSLCPRALRGVPRLRLTDAAVKAVKAKTATRDMYDEGEPGLCLRVQPSGRKAWGLRVRVARRQHRYVIGEYPATTLGEARELAARMKKAAKRGGDPGEVLRPASSDVPTVSDAVTVYLETKADNRSQEQERTRFKLHVEPVLGALHVDRVSKA